jgi:hypothetical protein
MAYSSRNMQIALLIAIPAIALVVGVVALDMLVLQNSKNAANVQTIGIEAYWDTARTNKLSTIDWGTIGPGETKNVTIYIVNTGNSNVVLSKNTTNWSSQNASNYITLNWNYQDQKIGPSQALQTTLTLSTSPDIKGVTTFSFDIVITASQ